MTILSEFLSANWRVLVGPAAVGAVTLVAGWLLRRVLFRWLHRWAGGTSSDLDDVLIAALRRPSLLWVLILSVHLALQSSALPPRVTVLAGRGLLVLWVLSLTLAAGALAAGFVRRFGPALQGAAPVTTLSQLLARTVVWTIGLLIILNTLGVSVTPILTALGVGGLAVALALQETLSNLFAGFHVSVAGNVRVGDYIKLDTGEEGFVVDISWRATTIRVLANNLVFVPNAKLAQAIVTNFTLPEPRMSLLIPVSVSYDSVPEVVERVLLDETMRALGQIPGLLAEPAPFVRFIPGFGESSIDFTVICQVAQFVDQYVVQHELRKRFFARLRAEGISIPFPTRTVHLAGGRQPAQPGPA